MAEDKVKMKKKTQDLKENIYALNFDFDGNDGNDKIEEMAENTNFAEQFDQIEEAEFVLKGYEEQEEPKKKKVLAKIEEGIKSSKRGRGRPRKSAEEKAEKAQFAKATKKSKKGEKEQKSIKMHTEDNLTDKTNIK